MFYERPVRLDRRAHANLRLRANEGFAFARAVNSVMLLGAEFAEAQRDYPIVFVETGDGRFFPAALLGLRERENLFVDSAGHWAVGCYVPAYVRRYPFVITGDMEVCVDEASTALSHDAGEPLFLDGGAEAPGLKQAQAFLATFHAEVQRTQAFCDTLRDLGLLKRWTVQVEPKGQAPLRLDGLYVIDDAKAADLPDATIGAWFRSGDLARLQAHVASLRTLPALARRLAEPQSASSQTESAAVAAAPASRSSEENHLVQAH